jgi:dephospho-CoA kinase
MQNSRPPFLVGVTGGIGAGKTSLCRCFGALGRLVVSADQAARDITDHDESAREEITRAFGRGAYRSDGSLDRPLIASIVFRDPAKLTRLNRIVHPRVFDAIDVQLRSIPPSKLEPYVVIEAALIFETGYEKRLDLTVAVIVPEEVAMERVVRRDGISRDEVSRRMQAQMPGEEKAKRADFVVHNVGPESGLEKKAEFIDVLIQKIREKT